MRHDAKQMSIRTRLLTGLIASLTLVLAAGCIGLYWSQRQMLRGEFDRRLEELAFAGMRGSAGSGGWLSRPPDAQI